MQTIDIFLYPKNFTAITYVLKKKMGLKRYKQCKNIEFEKATKFTKIVKICNADDFI